MFGKRRKNRLLQQKLLGAIMLISSIFAAIYLADGVNVHDKDATGLLFSIPIGLVMLFGNEIIF